MWHLVVFKCGQSSLYMGGRWGSWVVISMHGWLLPFMGGPFHAWAVVSVHRWSSLNMGDQVHVWVVLGIGQVIVACGVFVLCLSRDKIWKDGLTVFYKKEQ